MAGKSQYLELAILNWLKGVAFPAVPANTYVALLTTNPTTDSGTGLVEVSGNAYARVAVPSSGWSSISGGSTTPAQISNSAAITFPRSTGSWGTLTGTAIYDASTAGNLLYWTSVTSHPVDSGIVVWIAIGQLILTDD